MNLGYERASEQIPQSVPKCTNSVGGVDGTLFNLREPLLMDCLMCVAST